MPKSLIQNKAGKGPVPLEKPESDWTGGPVAGALPGSDHDMGGYAPMEFIIVPDLIPNFSD